MDVIQAARGILGSHFSSAPLVLPLREVQGRDRWRVGGKAANLGELIAAGFPVPRGFCVTTAAFDQFLEAGAGRDQILARLSRCASGTIHQIADWSGEVQACLGQAEMPATVKAALLAAWQELGEERTYAVRSSATVEDSPDRSFAGQFVSVLNVRGADALLQAVKSCWRSLFSPQALAYFARQQIALEKVRMAVVVQEMVSADFSGVTFTADPRTGATDRLVIEWVAGLGDELVQGKARPEQVMVAKTTGSVLTSLAGEPCSRSAASLVFANPADAGRSADMAACAPLLSSGSLAQLWTLACQIEDLFGSPQDIEWACREGKLWLLQSRPITHKPQTKSWEDRQVWANVNSGEVMPDVMTPSTWSLIQLLLGSVIRRVFRLHGLDADKCPVFGLVAGRGYFNVNTGLAALKPFSFLLSRIPNVARALGGGETESSRQLLQSIPDEDLPDLGFRWPKYILSWPRIFCDLIAHSPRRGDAWAVRLKVRMDELAHIDIEKMSTSGLVQFFTRLLQHGFDGWDLLYLGTQAAVLPVFQWACHHWLDDPELKLGYRLFSGLGGVPEAEAGLALWRLAAAAGADPQTESALNAGGSWADTLPSLQQTEPGRHFVSDWNAFMLAHGHHCRGELELFNARWSETPDYILGLVRGYLRTIGRANPLENQRRLAEERQQLTEQCRRRLKNPIKRWLFTRSLFRAQRLAVNREEWKNQAVRQIAVLRRVLLTLGQRLHAQGILAEPDDIFFLEVPEIEPVATGKAGFDARERIGARRREYQANLALNPPPVVVGKFNPNTPPATPSPDGEVKVLEGIAVSPGMATGRARVITRSDDHEQVLPGEILIAPFTDPAWTPYFVGAAGVVMDHGGILSHGSIVAREYGLPAVTSVGLATQRIRTGDLIQVDGNNGLVTILESALNH